MIRFIINLILLLLFVVLQISFLNSLNYPLNTINIILISIIFITVVLDYKVALFWSLGAGFVFELFSGFNFGIITISLFLTVILMNLLFNNFFTNRSFYSLLFLGFFAIFIFNFLLVLLSLPFYIFGFNDILFGIDRSYLGNMFWQFLLNLGFLAIIFIVFNFITKKLKNVFVIS